MNSEKHCPEQATLERFPPFGVHNFAGKVIAQLRQAGPILAIAAIYFCAGKFGLSLAYASKSASVVWPPTGIALAALLLGGNRLWPGIAIGAFFVNGTTAGNFATTLIISCGNTLEALWGAWLVRRLAGGPKAFDRTQDIFKFVVLAAMLSTAVSATFGVTSLCLFGFERWNHFWNIWLTWWLGDAVSNLTIAPHLLICLVRKLPVLRPKQIVEATCLVVSLLLVGNIIFLDGWPLRLQSLPVEYLGLPPLVWAAFRFTQRGAIAASFALSVIALWGTLHQLGPFALADPNESLLLLQAFTATITITTLVLASLVSERLKAERRLQVKNAVSTILTEFSTLNAAAPRIFEALSQIGGWEAAAIWNLDRKANRAFCEVTWQAPEVDTQELGLLLQPRNFSGSSGLTEQVRSNGRAVWRESSTVEKSSGGVTKNGSLRAEFAFPLKLGDEVKGVVEFYGRNTGTAGPEFVQMFRGVEDQLCQFVQHKRAEDEVRNSEELFRQVTENIHEVFWMSDVEKNQILYVSPGYKDIWGRPCEDLYASPRNWLEAIHPDDRARVLQSALTNQVLGRYNEVYRIVRPDSSIRWIQDRAFPVRDRMGRIYRIAGLALDITERMRADEALRESEARKGAVMEAAVDGIITIDASGQIVELNSAAEKMFGHSRAEILRRSMAELIIPEQLREWFQRGMNDFFVDGEGPTLGARVELTALRAHGLEFPAEFTIARVKLDGPPMFTAFFRDISGRKRAETQLARLGHAIETTTEPIYITDFQNRFTFANHAFEKTYGYSDKDILGKNTGILFSARNPAGLADQILAKALLDGWRGDVYHLRKDGTEFPVFVSTSQVKDRTGCVIGVMRVAQDITDRKRAEEESRQLSGRIIEAQEAERLRIARELHDSVNQVIASAKMRLRKVEDSVAAVDPAAGEILTRCYELLAQALEENRRIAYNLRPSDLDEFGLTAACRNFCKEFASRAGLKVKSHLSRFDERLPPTIELNLFRIVQEAFSNAERHARASEVRLRMTVRGGFVGLVIQDNGCGFNVGASKGSRGRERGIGLTNMRERAASLGGACQVTSAPGQGTTVTVRVPNKAVKAR